MSLRYAVYPGFVMSKTDGDRHFIAERELMALYGVRPDECLVIRDSDRLAYGGCHKLDEAKKLIALRPNYQGNYTLPTA